MKRRTLVAAAVAIVAAAAVVIVMVMTNSVFANGLVYRYRVNRGLDPYHDSVIAEVVNDSPTNFGWDPLLAAQKKGKDPQNFIVHTDKEGKVLQGDWIDALAEDPGIFGANVVEMQRRLGLTGDVPQRFFDGDFATRPNRVRDWAMKNRQEWRNTVSNIASVLAQHGTIEFGVVPEETMSMGMSLGPDGIPDIFTAYGNMAGKKSLIVSYNGKEMYISIQCNYQPFWQRVEGEDTSNRLPNPDPAPDPTPSQVVDPKDPNGGPQGQNPTSPEYGGGVNHEIDKNPTNEPTGGKKPHVVEPSPEKPAEPEKPAQPAEDVEKHPDADRAPDYAEKNPVEPELDGEAQKPIEPPY